MKVIVFGATGTIRRLAVESILDAGHEVTTFARNPDRLEITHRKLSLAKGDATSSKDVKSAVDGHEAVVILLESGKAVTGTIRSEGTLTTIKAMQTMGVKRLICQSTLGAHESWSKLNFFWKRIMFGLVLRSVLQDHELQEHHVQANGLDWTIVRPSAFTDVPNGTEYHEDIRPDERSLTLKIARAEVAAFISRQVVERAYVHRAVGISA